MLITAADVATWTNDQQNNLLNRWLFLRNDIMCGRLVSIEVLDEGRVHVKCDPACCTSAVDKTFTVQSLPPVPPGFWEARLTPDEFRVDEHYDGTGRNPNGSVSTGRTSLGIISLLHALQAHRGERRAMGPQPRLALDPSTVPAAHRAT